MNCYIFKSLKIVSENYHPDGGVVVFAESFQRAKELAVFDISAYAPEQFEEFNKGDMYFILSKDGRRDGLDQSPDIILNNVEHKEEVIVFPNAGCC